MKRLFYTLGFFAVALVAHAKLNIVATLPDFAAIAEEIGGDKVKVTSMARGTEDAHFIDARPSLIRLLNQADVLIEGGADLEVGWLPPLVNNARNPKLLGASPNHLVLAHAVELLDVPTGPIDRSMGDVHPMGNPHFWLDPANGKRIASAITSMLARVDAKNAGFYQSNLKKFDLQLDDKLAEWSKAMEPFRGTKVVTYHRSFDYFLKRFGFELVATLEPKPGIEPSPTHINALVPKMREAGVKLVIIEPFHARRTAEHVARAAGSRLVVLPEKVGGNEKAKDYWSLFDYNVSEIIRTLKAK